MQLLTMHWLMPSQSPRSGIPTQTHPSNFVILHDAIWYGILLWSAYVSSPESVFSQLTEHFHPPCGPDFPKHSIFLATIKKINSIPFETRIALLTARAHYWFVLSLLFISQIPFCWVALQLVLSCLYLYWHYFIPDVEGNIFLCWTSRLSNTLVYLAPSSRPLVTQKSQQHLLLWYCQQIC